MMAKLGKTMRVDRSRVSGYLSVGRALHGTARDLAELAESRYGNGMAIVAIHAAIAYTDALTVAYGGREIHRRRSRAGRRAALRSSGAASARGRAPTAARDLERQEPRVV